MQQHSPPQGADACLDVEASAATSDTSAHRSWRHLHQYHLSSCRFDVRALLDFYKEPDPRVLAARQKSHEESKLEEVRV
jgi:hypothetical protein